MKRLLRNIVNIVGLFVLLFIASAPLTTHAATYTWDGGGVDNNWNTCANWSSDTCPLTTDSVVFSATSTKNADINVDITVSSFSINSGYTGVIAPLASQLITINSTFVQSSGTFTASAATTSMAGDSTFTGGTFNHNSGTVYFTGTGSRTITPNATVFQNVTFDTSGASGATITTSIASDMTILGNLSVQSMNTANGTFVVKSNVSGTTRAITVGGDLLFPSTAQNGNVYLGDYAANTFPLNVVLSGNFTMSDSNANLYADLTFASSSTQTLTKTAGSINAFSEWYDTGAGDLALVANFSASQALNPDSATDFNFVPTAFTFTSGSLVMDSGDVFTPNGPSLYSFITVNLTGGTFNPTASTSIATLTINGGTFNAASNSTTTVTGNFTYTSGTFNHNSGIMYFAIPGSVTITPNAAVFNNVTFDFPGSSSAAITASIASDMTIAGNLSVQSTNTSSGSYVIRSSVSGTTRAINVAGDLIFPSTSPSTASAYLGDYAANTFPLNIVLNGNFTMSDSNANLYADLTFASSSTQTLIKTAGSINVFSEWYDTGAGNLALTANFGGSQNLNPDSSGDFTFVATPFTFSSRTATIATSSSFTPAGPASYIFTNLAMNTGGTFNMTASTSILAYSQTWGTFNALASATTTFAGDFTYTGGTFNHNNGTVYFTFPGGSTTTVTPNAIAFNNVTFDMPGSFVSSSYFFALGSNMTVNGNFTVQNTNIDTGFYTLRSNSTATRTIAIAGDLLIPSTASGATLFLGSTANGNPLTLALQGNLTQADSNSQIFADIIFASSSTQTISRIAGTINAASDWFDTGSGNLALIGNFTGAQVLQPDSPTDFNFVPTAFTFTSGTLVIAPGGAFTPAGPSSYNFASEIILATSTTFTASTNVVLAGGLSMAGGTFNASAGTTTFSSVFSYTGFIYYGGIFNHNNGTVIFDMGSSGMTVAPGAADLYNVVFDYTATSTNSLYMSIGSNINALGNMVFRSNQPSSGIMQVRSSVSGTPRSITVGGDLSLATTSPSTASVFIGESSGSTHLLNFTVYGNFGMYDSGNWYSDITFASSSDQTVSKTAGSILSLSDWTINKPASSTLVLLNPLTTSGTLNIATGTVRTGGFNLTTAVAGLSVGAAGTLLIQGGETVSTTTFATGSTMVYEGTVGPYTVKPFSYKNLTFQGNGATFNISTTTTISQNLRIASGTLDVSLTNYGLFVGGNWANTGTFVPRSGTVTLNGTGQSITGTTTFYRLTKSVATADTLTFGANQTQTITNTWTANGVPGNLLSLRSSSPGTQWKINPQSTRTLSYVDVQDSNNINLVTIPIDGTMVNSGNNTNWSFDIAPPTATGTVVTPTATTASIVWGTDEAATSTFKYGLTSAYGTASTSSGTTTHAVTITGLTSSTVYHYAVVSTDAAGNTATTTDATFTTLDVTAPVITAGATSTGTTTASIAWSTDEAATSTVEYGLTASYGSFATSSGTSTHSVALTGLASTTTYHYRITATDINGNIATTSDQTFLTAATPDTTPAIISNGSPSTVLVTGTTNTTISVDTNEPATCKYGTVGGTTYGSIVSTFGTTGGINHTENISGLADGNSYTYYVRCEDANGNQNTSDYTLSFSVASAVIVPPAPDLVTVQPIRLVGPLGGSEQMVPPPQLQPQAPVIPPGQIKFIFKKDLAQGMNNADVKELQKFLNKNGFVIAKSGVGSPGRENTSFGPATKTAVLKFQIANKIKGANGRFGPGTRAVVNAMKQF